MESLRKALPSINTDDPHFPYMVAAGGGLLALSGFALYKLLRRNQEPVIPQGPPNTALIFQLKKGPKAPSMSPFPVKLEMYCRLAGIPYESRPSSRRSHKGKIPWMVYNGEVVADSQFCIEFFKRKLGVDVNKQLNAQQRAVSKMVQVMADEHLYWTMVYFRWINENEYFPNLLNKYFHIPKLAFSVIKRRVRGQLHAQGIGRHTPEQIKKILMDDLQALSDLLGSKPYMVGPELCEGDCAAFGMLCQFAWHQEDKELHNILQDNFPNLYNYCHRVKERVWPRDWDECCRG